jgi:hypothetical protein
MKGCENMSIVQYSDYRTYCGLSTDTKPTTGVRIGDKFEELDTSKLFKFNGTEWVEWIQRVTVVT